MSARAALLIAALGAGGPACLATAGAPPVAQTFEARTYTMPSGLRVAVERDDSAKIAGLAWVVEGGHGDDPADKPGLAHLVEHLLYSLPDETGRSVYRRLLDLGAGDVNAQTAADTTMAYAFARRDALDDLARILVARMSDPGRGLDEARLAHERLILAEEIAVIGANGKRSLGALMNGLSQRPFLFPLDGAREALARITVDDVRAFIAAHYRPERMTVVISGPIPVDWDHAFLSRLPRSLAGVEGERRAPVRLGAAPVVARAARQLEIASAADSVLERQLWLAWPLPPASGVELVPFRLAASLASRLLTEKGQDGELPAVSGGEATVIPSKSGNLFLWRLDLRAGADPEVARREARQVLELITALPVARWLTRERSQAELRLQEARVREGLEMESLVTRTLRRAAIVHDAPDQSMSDVVKAVIDTSLNGIANVVANNLAAAPARSLLLVPSEARPTGPPPAPGAPLGQGLDTDPESPDDVEPSSHDARDITAVAQGPGVSAARVSRLANGLTLIVMRRPGLPFTSALLGFHASPLPDDPPGVRFVVPRALTFQGVKGPLQRGILELSRVDHDSYQESFTMFSQATASALDLLSSEDGAGSVTWPTAATNELLRQQAVTDGTPAARLARALRGALYGGHVYRAEARSEEMRTVRSEDVRAWLSRTRRPANAVLVVVGDVDEAAVTRQVQDELGGWSGDPAPPAPAPPPAQAAAATRSLPTLTDADPRRTWTQLQFGCFLPPARSPRDIVVGELLSDVIRTELYRRLRVEHGTSYSPTVRWTFYRGGTHVMTGSLDVDEHEAARALALIHDWLDPAGAAAPLPRAIEDARWRSARVSGLRYATNGALAHRLFDAWNMGWTPASLDAYPQDLASVTPDEITAALAACRASAVVSVLSPR